MSDMITIPYNDDMSFTAPVDAVRKVLAEYDAKHTKPENQEAEVDWQRVIDEGYLCGVSNISQETAQKEANEGVYMKPLNKYRPDKIKSFLCSGNLFWKYCAWRKVPNEIQPHFGGGMPDGVQGEYCTIHLRDGNVFTEHISSNFHLQWIHNRKKSWEDIVAFIIHRPIITEMMRHSSCISKSQGVADG